jgi:hypothetical protein
MKPIPQNMLASFNDLLKQRNVPPPLLARIVKILRLNLLIAFAFQGVLYKKLASPLKIG